ncbi:MAG TPA: hypothetical protein VF649_10805 [Sphingomonas sp.]|jgi:hypothetical protein
MTGGDPDLLTAAIGTRDVTSRGDLIDRAIADAAQRRTMATKIPQQAAPH